jgi:autotransporter-associated beta strand protein
MQRIIFITLFIFFSTSVFGQTLTISSGGETGTSGTNWSISGNVLNVAASGTATVHPSVITNHLNNIGDLTVVLPPQANVNRDILINSNISYTGSIPRSLLINSANNILLANGIGITSSTAALNLVLRAAMGANPDNGLVNLDGTTIATKGGHFWVGGGNLSTTWNGLTVGAYTARSWTDDIAALSMKGGSLTTNGGNIYLAAISHDSVDDNGVNYGITIDNYSISSETGNITIDGSLNGRYSSGVATNISATIGSVSISTTTGAISIFGTGSDQVTNGNSWRVGTYIKGTSSTIATTISSVSGNISINGTANFAATFNDKEGIVIAGSSVSIVSQTGNIEIKGTNSLESSGQYCNSIRFSPLNNANAIRIGFNGTNTYSGNLLIEGNSIYQRDNQIGSGSISIQSTGSLTIQPSGTAFTYMRADNAGTLTFDDDWNFGTQLSSFTYGKTTNSTNLTYESPLTVAGPINFYTGNLTLNQDITSALSGAAILLQATGAINLAASKTIQSNGGNITLRSNAGGTAISADSSIVLNSGSTLASQRGNITLGGNFTGAQGAGLYATSNNSPAILINGGIISAAGGNIKLYGKCNTSYDDGIRLQGTVNTTGAGTIEFYGEAHGGFNGTDFFGGITFGSSAGSTIETENGSLILNGLLTNTQNNSTGAINFYRNTGSTGQTRHINLLSKTGNVTVNADRGTTSAYGIGHSSWGNVYVGSPASGWTATGNVVFNYSSLVNAGYNGIKVKTTGAVTYQPSATSFAAAQTFPANANYVLAESASSLTIGKAGNTANFTMGAATTVAGPISVYAGTITLNADLTSTASGDISLYSDAALAGLSSARTLTTSGAFKYMPNSTSFSSTVTFPITNLTLTNVTGLQLGKSGNTSGITIGTATSVNGYVTVFGGALALNANLTTTSTTGNINLNGTSVSGTGNLILASNRTATLNVSSNSTYDGIISGTGSGLTKAGAGLLTLTKDHTYTGTTTISAGDLQVGTGGSVSQASSGTVATTSGVAVASGSKFILSPNENIVFAAPISGAGGLEIKGASGRYLNTWLNGTPTLLAANTTVLEALTRITGGLMGGTAISGGLVPCGAYQKSYTASTNTGTLQLQLYDGSSTTFFTKCVFVKLTQSGSNVMIQVNTTIYETGAGYVSGNLLGSNISTGGNSMSLASSSSSAGYGISEIYLSGKVNFTGILAYTGNTVLSNTVTSVSNVNNIYSYTSKGTQEITDASSSFPAASTVVNNGLVILNRTTPIAIASNMEGTEDVLQVGAQVSLTGTCTYTGNTTIDLNKTLAIGSGSGLGSITGNIINYGSLIFDRSDNSNYVGIVSGTGTLVKSGAGEHTLTGLNTYTGATTINAGKLILERNVPITSSTGFSGTGELVIQPSSASFTNALNYPLSGFTVSSTIGGLTIGKLGNTANLTVTNNTSADGPITFFSGTITLNANVTANNNGAISFYSDNAIAGLSAQRNVTAAGSFNYIPQSNSFAAAVSYPITNLNLSSSGLQIGKLSNATNITFGSNTSIAGPITAYGGIVTLDANLTTTNNGNIALYTDNPLGGLSTARTLTVAGAFKYIPRGTAFTADVTYPITNLTATSTGLTIGKTTNDKNITISQDVIGGAGIELYGNNLNINANLKTTSSANMYLKGNATIAATKYIQSNGDFTHDGNLIFKSTDTGTAAFGSLGGTFTKVSGTATVERYVPAKRGWRLLTAPLKGATNTTIPSNWQGITGEGLVLFSPVTYQSNSMTGYTTGGGSPNIWKYNNGWQSIPNLTAENLFTSTGNSGFLVFATGPSDSANIVTDATVTTLKPKGDLITGNVTHTLTANEYKLIANPYASPINTVNLAAANTGSKIWMVDPTLGTYGGYATYDGTDWTPVAPTTNDAYIQSGQGFFVRAASNTTFTISESHKVSGNSNTWFQRSAAATKTTETADKIRVLLYKQNNAEWKLSDGVLAVNSASGNNEVDNTDTGKMSNFNENLLFRNGTSNLAIEYKGLPAAGTTQPMCLTGTTVQPYQLRVKTESYFNSDLQPYLEDTQAGILTAIPTDGSEVVLPFTGVVASSTNQDSRFRIVYQSSLGTNKLNLMSVGVYPNPVNAGVFTVLLKENTTPANYKLTNLLGQQVQVGKLMSLSNSVNVTSLQVGIYILEVEQQEKTFTTKLIIK